MTVQPDFLTRIDRYLPHSPWSGLSPRVTALAGDASDRRYFRVQLQNGRSLVLAVYPGPFNIDDLSFVNVTGLLQRMPLPVPAILGHSNAEGILALEDLGDVTLQRHLESTAAADMGARYREAIGLIEVIQRRGGDLAAESYLPYRLAFDVDKLTWELAFFVEHFLEAHRGASLSAADRNALSQEWQTLATELAADPRVLCHRDYHSRNLMVHDGRLHVIDFQDARLGPDTYDLASLLRDSYVDLSEPLVDELIAHFLAVTRRDPKDAAEFRRRFDLMSLQRNLKALGTFGFQATALGRTAYLESVPRTLGHVRRNLKKYDRFARLHDLLATHVQELR